MIESTCVREELAAVLGPICRSPACLYIEVAPA
jgi:hypothetical protein